MGKNILTPDKKLLLTKEERKKNSAKLYSLSWRQSVKN